MINQTQNRRKRLRAHGSLSLILPENQSFKLPPVSQRCQTKRHEKALSSYKLVDYSMSRIAYKGEKLQHLSSKIDFFNPENQRKLDVSRKNILKQVGAEPFEPKPRPMRHKRKHNLPPALHSLVQVYLKKKEQVQQKQGEYMVVGAKNKFVFY